MTRAADNKRLPNWGIGLIAIALVVIGFYLAFAKSIPFLGGGYEVKAVFADAQNIRAKSPVRIAGVEVGKVTKVENLVEDGEGQQAALLTVELKEDARPIHEDATMQLRPRLFLEGNLFVDLKPGSPGTPEIEDGGTVPISQTSNSVQVDEVLTSLQAPVREDLQTFLIEFGNGLDKYGGAEGFNEAFRTSPAAFRDTARVNEALLGTTPGDLRSLIGNLDRFVNAFDARAPQLQDLITNLRIVSGSFAADTDSLEAAIAALPGVVESGRTALFKLNRSLPALRAFAREALPGVKAANPALKAANPWIKQMRRLVSKPELRGLVDDLRPQILPLSLLARRTIPFFEEARALSSCFNNVVIPWSNDEIPVSPLDEMRTPQVYKETGYSLAGVAQESRSGDANGQQFKVLGGGGTNTFSSFIPDLPGGGDLVAGVTPFDLQGTQPAKQSSAKTPFRPDVPCETQEPPNLNATVGKPPPESEVSGVLGAGLPESVDESIDRYGQIFNDIMKAEGLEEAGQRAAAKRLREATQEALREWEKNDLQDYLDAIRARARGGGD
jgi:phospholipid/cholesterol/gamma-HCH transport system substrate-binding protein